MTPEEIELKRESDRAASVVGQIILIGSIIDSQLNSICISLLHLTPSPMLEPTISVIEISRKIEIMKSFSSKLSTKNWKKEIKRHAERVESFIKWRNIAAHCVLGFKDGKAVLYPIGIAKLLKSIDLGEKVIEHVDIDQLESAIKESASIMENGENLRNNLARAADELARRTAQ